eukprot:gene9389-1636_t
MSVHKKKKTSASTTTSTTAAASTTTATTAAMADGFRELLMDMPVVTRAITLAATITTAAVQFKLVSTFDLYYNVENVLKGEVWRLVTTFLFFGKFSIDWCLHIFFVYRYCRMLEEGSFRGRSADLLFMLILGAIVLLVITPLFDFSEPFLGFSLTCALTYVWARRNPHVHMAFLGIFVFRAPLLPWILLGFGVILGHNPISDFLGIVVGHIYFFLEDVYAKPRSEGGLGGPRILKTPHFLRVIIDGEDDAPVTNEPVVGEDAGGFNWGDPPQGAVNGDSDDRNEDGNDDPVQR